MNGFQRPEKYVCLDCRKVVKVATGSWCMPLYDPPCPDCKQETRLVGKWFKAPRRADIGQWKKVRLMLDAGYNFASQGSAPRLGSLGDARRHFVAKSRRETGLQNPKIVRRKRHPN